MYKLVPNLHQGGALCEVIVESIHMQRNSLMCYGLLFKVYMYVHAFVMCGLRLAQCKQPTCTSIHITDSLTDNVQQGGVIYTHTKCVMHNTVCVVNIMMVTIRR